MRNWSLLLFAVILGSALLLEGCNACYNNKPSSPEQVRQATADATAKVKEDAKALAEGLRDGLRRPSTDQPLDLNTASKGDLESLPGISEQTAERIVANRPYRQTHDLLDRRLVTREEYESIASRVTVK
jgi:DNA uptake protein ComE-like DNA-binding protein